MAPTLDRRTFVKSMGAAGAAAAAGPLPGSIEALLVPTDRGRTRQAPRVAVLAEPGFPTIDALPLNERILDRALAGAEATPLRVADLERLTPDDFDVYLNPYGSAFPKQAWGQLLQFLVAGGNWVNLGGAPFAVPVVRDAGAWRPEVRQTAYHKRLGITQAFRVPVSEADEYSGNIQLAWTEPLADQVRAETVYELYYRLTREKEYPDEDGSDGPREAVIEPLVSISRRGEHPTAAPVVRLDRLLGPYAGGRWILANFEGSISAAALGALVHDAALGVHRLTLQPSAACYHAGESPALEVRLKSPDYERGTTAACRITVLNDAGDEIATTTIPLEGSGFAVSATVELDISGDAALAPGLYPARARLESDDPAIDGLGAASGYWVFDAELLAGGPRFTTDEHTLLRDGDPYIVTGTSYMASEVHRRFLLSPNPYIWDRDFAAMKRAGINMIRTGIWTGWRNYMSGAGELNESALRALDAFLLTARRHEIPVIFTLFAFVPEDWGGANPYLDRRAIEAQKRYVAGIVRRYGRMNDVIWDLINEPSCCSPDRLWVTRPNYDEHEERAWTRWLMERFPSESYVELDAKLAELWRTLPGDALRLPRLDEFDDRNIFEGLRPLKAMEYRLFANDVFTRWASEMAATIHEAGSPAQLVTVGQDEGGTYERPGPAFHAPVVDFTSNHTWWLNDDLLWDSVVSKTPDRPNLISETGIMFYEKIDGSAWRSEEEARDLLERKLAIATVAGGAGWIEWIWNTNPYMPLDNEAAIGLLRADGSAKPELHVLREMAKFVAGAAPRLGPRKRDPAVMVIPHSHMFSVRNFATQATQRCVRAMHYHCRVTMSAVSEYGLERLGGRAQLIVVPSPRIMTEEAWRRLIERASAGATLLITGPIDFDEHWLPVPRLEAYGIRTTVGAVADEEDLELDGATLRLSYRDLKIERVEKAIRTDAAASRVITLPVGSGSLIWSPLPVELAEQVEPTVALYRYALDRAGIEPLFASEPDDPGLLVYPAVHRDAVLYAVVSELARPTTVRLTHRESGARVTSEVPAGGAVLLALSRDGQMLGSYERR